MVDEILAIAQKVWVFFHLHPDVEVSGRRSWFARVPTTRNP